MQLILIFCGYYVLRSVYLVKSAKTNTVIVWKVYESHIRAKSKVDSFSRMEWQVHFAVGDPPVMS